MLTFKEKTNLLIKALEERKTDINNTESLLIINEIIFALNNNITSSLYNLISNIKTTKDVYLAVEKILKITLSENTWEHIFMDIDNSINIAPKLSKEEKNLLKLAMIYEIDFPVVYKPINKVATSYTIPKARCKYLDEDLYEVPKNNSFIKSFEHIYTVDNWFDVLPEQIYTHICNNQIDYNFVELKNKLILAIKNYSPNSTDTNINTPKEKGYEEEYLKLERLKLKLKNLEPITSFKDLYHIKIAKDFYQIRKELI